MDLFHCPICLFQTGQADGPFSTSCLHVPSVRVCQTQTGQADWPFSQFRLARHVLVRPLWKRQSEQRPTKTIAVCIKTGTDTYFAIYIIILS